MQFSTRSIHVGQAPEEQYGAMIPPIYMTSTYIQEAPGKFKYSDYTRYKNPNFGNLEQTLASLENGSHATVFSSGLGAITAIASTLKQGDKVIAINDLYGGTYRLFTSVFSNFGIDFELVDFSNPEALEASLNPQDGQKPKLIFLESPTNPLLKISDIGHITSEARKHGVLSVVDNTFASPYFQNPLDLGADVVMHSSTKYLGGHSDLIGGALITNDASFNEKMLFARMAIGLNPSPFDCWLTTRSLKSLAVRMERHAENAQAVAEFLSTHPKVSKVYFPGLPSHPNHEIAAKQMSGFSGMVSVEFNLTLEQSKQLISSFKIFSLAESLGGVESLVDHPASMTHASIPAEERQKMGLADGLVRLSTGLENKEDIIEDLKKALEAF